MKPAWRESLSTSRIVSAAEVALGAAIVIGHNVFRVVPNEVPILFVLGWLSLRIRNGGLSTIGLQWPPSWRSIVLIALGAAALRLLLGEYVIEPLTAMYWPAAKAPAGAEQITGNLGAAALALLVAWTFAAFGEEIVYRGYLLTRAADLGARSAVAYVLAVLLTSVLFGYGHYYKGPAGVLDSGVAGLILGSAYLLGGRNLWACILAHVFIDTFAVVALFLGWAD